MKKIIAWFAKISTPPDSRLAGHRHFPPIGNTYISEPSGEFALLAYLWKDGIRLSPPRCSGCTGSTDRPRRPGIGGFFPTLAGYRTMLRDESIPAVAPRVRQRAVSRNRRHAAQRLPVRPRNAACT